LPSLIELFLLIFVHIIIIVIIIIIIIIVVVVVVVVVVITVTTSVREGITAALPCVCLDSTVFECWDSKQLFTEFSW
jgi:phage-related minor tail protein